VSEALKTLEKVEHDGGQIVVRRPGKDDGGAFAQLHGVKVVSNISDIGDKDLAHDIPDVIPNVMPAGRTLLGITIDPKNAQRSEDLEEAELYGASADVHAVMTKDEWMLKTGPTPLVTRAAARAEHY
jgi:hypothetical protein